MEKLILEKLKHMVKSNKLKFGFQKEITEFILDSYKEKNENTIVCICKYIENGNIFQKLVELNI